MLYTPFCGCIGKISDTVDFQRDKIVSLTCIGSTATLNSRTITSTGSVLAGPCSLYIFAMHTLDISSATEISSMLLCSFKMTEGATVKRDFVPCKNPSGKVGLYDLASKEFFGNAGSGDFLPVYAVTRDANAADVAITSVEQTPGSGKATVNYMVSGLKSKTDIVITAVANGKSTAKTVANVGNGSGSVEIDYKTALGAAPNVAFSAALTDPDVEGVQLWKDGPYWATCNVGATKPEGNGYYFWWGDTVGYWYPSTKWTSVWNSSTTISFSTVNNAAPSNKTYGKNPTGYLDSNKNLNSWCDAATAHLGAPWRMPTSDELKTLINGDICAKEWTTLNSVKGLRIKGKGDFASKSIFLPAAGYGCVAGHGDYGNIGDYWSSSAGDNTSGANMMQLITSSQSCGVGGCDRRFGLSIRAVRTFAK